MKNLNRILDILAFVLGCVLIVALCVGLSVYGGLPLRDLPSWVWFVAAIIIGAFWRKPKE